MIGAPSGAGETRWVEPAQAVEEALEALGTYPRWIPGRVWRAVALLQSKVLPRHFAISMVRERLKQFGKK